MPVFLGQDRADPFPERGRRLSQVDGHIKHFAFHHADQLALRALDLIVQPAQHVAGRPRMVVLHELDLTPHRRLERGLVETLVEIAARVAKHPGFDQQHVTNGKRSGFHQNTDSFRIRNRYWP
ncbi:hypothetical protein D3C72_1535310 [compost metagenome]